MGSTDVARCSGFVDRTPAKRVAATLGGLLIVFCLPLVPTVGLWLWLEKAAGWSPITAWWAVNLARPPIFAAALLGWLRYVEREPFTSIGFRRPSIGDLLGGFGVFVLCQFLNRVASRAAKAALVAAGQGWKLDSHFQTLASLPVWVTLVLDLEAAWEDIGDRGYTIERMYSVTGSLWLAGALSLAGDVAVHMALWGSTGMIYLGLPLAPLALLYMWRRNVWSCIIAHVLGDVYTSFAPQLLKPVWPVLPPALRRWL